MKKELKDKIAFAADKAAEYCLYAAAFFIPISISAIEVFVSLALAAFIVKKIISPDLAFIKSRLNFFLLLFFIFCGLSLLNSGPYLDKSLFALFFKWGKNITIFFLVQDTLNSGKRIRNTVTVLLLVGCIMAIDGLSQRFFGREFIFGGQMHAMNYAMTRGLSAVTGPFDHYNDFAAYLVPVAALFGAALSGKGNNRVVFCGLLSGLCLSVACLALTYSRGGWVGLGGAVLLMLFLSGNWKGIVPILCFFMLAVILVPLARERAVFIFQSGGDAERYGVWKGAWGMIKDHPFLGKGIGTFMANFAQYTKGLGIRYAHNCYLQIWAETGVFALISFISFLWLLLRQGINSFRRSRDHAVLGLLCAIFGFSIHSFFDTHLYSLQLSELFWFMSGMLVVNSARLKP